jgi:hypothetical protein
VNWYELKSRCIDHVAREIARPRVQKSRRTDIRPMEEWAEMQKAAEPEAVEKINGMSNMELLDLVSEVVGMGY